MKATSRADDIICLKTVGVRRKIDTIKILRDTQNRDLTLIYNFKTMIHITFDVLERHKWLHRRGSLEIILRGGNLKSAQNRSMGQTLTAITSLQTWRFLQHRWETVEEVLINRSMKISQAEWALLRNYQAAFPCENRSAFWIAILNISQSLRYYTKIPWSPFGFWTWPSFMTQNDMICRHRNGNISEKILTEGFSHRSPNQRSNQLLHCCHITKIRGNWIYRREICSLHSGQTVDVENDSNTLEICLEVRPSPNLANQRVHPLPQPISQQRRLRLKRWSYAFDRHIWSYRIRWDTASNSSNWGIFHMGQNCPTGRTNVLPGGRPGG